MNQPPQKDSQPEDPRPPSCLTCGVVIGTQNVTAPDDWCREHRPRNLRGVAVRDESW